MLLLLLWPRKGEQPPQPPPFPCSHCGFVMHTAQDRFVAHVFHCEPSAGALCKTIEAACKLRYQKCLDAHRQAAPHPSAPATPPPAAKVGSSVGFFPARPSSREPYDCPLQYSGAVPAPALPRSVEPCS